MNRQFQNCSKIQQAAKNNNVVSEHTNTKKSISKYKETLTEFSKTFSIDLTNEQFDIATDYFANFLKDAIHLLPGPKHPAQKYFDSRKAQRAINTQITYSQNSNPQRQSKRDKERRKNKYRYEEIQFLYYNERRKAIRKVLNEETPLCHIQIKDVENRFSSLWSTPNNCVRTEYDPKFETQEKHILDDIFDDVISKDEIIKATKGISVDTAAGHDGVLVGRLKMIWHQK